MSFKKFSLVAGLIFASVAFSQTARAEDPVSSLVTGAGGVINDVGQGAGKGVTQVLDNVTGNKTTTSSAPVAAAPAPVAVHHHHHHHHHHH